MGVYSCKFLKGETPSDLPVEELLIRPECALKNNQSLAKIGGRLGPPWAGRYALGDGVRERLRPFGFVVGAFERFRGAGVFVHAADDWEAGRFATARCLGGSVSLSNVVRISCNRRSNRCD